MNDQDFTAMRRAMVESQLRTNDVNDVALIRAILAVPRERFVPDALRSVAYIDRPVPLPGGRALNPPLATARLISAAQIRAGQSVLIIGAATGYCAAIVAHLGARVTAVECDADLAAAARAALTGCDAQVVTAPLAGGAPEGAPYDRIIVDGSIERLPDAIIEQIAIDGRATFADMDRGVSRLCSGVRTAGGFGATPFADTEAVPLPGFAVEKGFAF